MGIFNYPYCSLLFPCSFSFSPFQPYLMRATLFRISGGNRQTIFLRSLCFCCRTESSRPFISGQVAHTMASEVISLLHGLLASSASETAQIWASAVRDVLCEALDYVPDLMKTLEAKGRASLRGDQTPTQEPEPEEDELFSDEHEWFFKARNVVASLCALGGFRQNIHSGCTVQV